MTAPSFNLPATPYSHLLGSDVPAYSTLIDHVAVEGLIQSAEEQRAKVYRSLQALKSQEAQLALQHTELTDFVERHRSLVPPLQRLSAEILGLIFQECMGLPSDPSAFAECDADDEDFVMDWSSDTESSYHDSDADPEFDIDSDETEFGSVAEDFLQTRSDFNILVRNHEHGYEEAVATLRYPWVFTHVCRFWRATALSFPRLWTHLEVFADKQFLPNFRGTSLPLLHLQLQNAASFPLDVNFYSDLDNDESRCLLSVLLSHSQQWRMAHLQLPLSLVEFIHNSITEHMIAPQFNQLTVLTIDLVSRGGVHTAADTASHPHSPDVRVFKSAFGLRELHLLSTGSHGRTSFPVPSLAQFPLHQITRLTFHARLPEVFRFLSLVKDTAEEVFLKILAPAPGVPVSWPSQPVLLKRVTTLSIHLNYFEHSYERRIVDLILPERLEDLALLGYSFDIPMLDLQRFVSRVSSTLMSLSTDFPITGDYVHRIVEVQ